MNRARGGRLVVGRAPPQRHLLERHGDVDVALRRRQRELLRLVALRRDASSPGTPIVGQGTGLGQRPISTPRRSPNPWSVRRSVHPHIRRSSPRARLRCNGRRQVGTQRGGRDPEHHGPHRRRRRARQGRRFAARAHGPRTRCPSRDDGHSTAIATRRERVPGWSDVLLRAEERRDLHAGADDARLGWTGSAERRPTTRPR